MMKQKSYTGLEPKISRAQIIMFDIISDKTYGDYEFTVSAKSSSGLPVVFTSSGSCSVAGNIVHINKAGTCVITAHQDGDDDFETARDVSQTFNVVPAKLIVKAEDKTVVYGGQSPVFSANISGLVHGPESLGNIIFESTARLGSPIGAYPITPGGLSSPNYTYTYVPGTLTIVPASLTIKADDKGSTYGSPLPEYTATASGLVKGDTLESLGKLVFSTTATLESPVGNYPIRVDGLTSQNYTYSYVVGNLEVRPAFLSVKTDDKDIKYGTPLPEFTAIASGLVNEDKLESLGTLKFSTSASGKSSAGTYPITPGGLTSPNYIYNFVDGCLTILPSPVKEILDNKEPAIDREVLSDVAIANSNDEKPSQSIKKRPRLGETLIEDGTITHQELATTLSRQLDIPLVDIKTYQFEREALKLVSEEAARKYNVIPLAIRVGYLVVAMSDPTDIMAIEALSAITRMRIRPMIALSEEIHKAIDRNYESLGKLEKQFTDVKQPQIEIKQKILDDSIAEAPAVRALDIIVEEAIKNRASDIHIEPEAEKVRIRYRIDGVLHVVSFLPLSAHAPLISRLKVLSDMNIADHRPQDGQLTFKAWDKDVDIRVATINTACGEMGTLRILDKSLAARNLTNIGFSPKNLETYQKMLKSPFGMVLVSGPTGSGKTTTLYASINSLDCEAMKIITIEDPVEYHFDGINQIQVNQKAGITFSGGLRATMRHDPDVVLVGEIRDTDTAAVAVQAAMTGHLVLASVHANDTVGVLFRLIDLGVEPFLLASGLIGVIAQRMVRRVCPNCSREVPASVEHQAAYKDELGESRDKFYYGAGCQACANTGYLGRIAVMEVLTVSDEIKRLLLNGSSTAQIRAQGLKEGMTSMRYDGMLKVKTGTTTPSEVLRNVFSI